MAAASLIDRYLTTFRAQVRLRHDRADLVDEITDHLLCAVEQFQGRGLTRDAAERRALAALGDPRLVASLMTTIPSKGTIMSYVLSRYVWVSAAIATLAWLAAGISSPWGFTDVFGWTPSAYYVSTSLLGLAGLATTAVLLGANLRVVGRFDAATGWITGLAVVASLVCAAGLAWLVVLWVPLLTIAVALTLSRVVRTDSRARPARVATRVTLGVIGVVAVMITLMGLVVEVTAVWAILGMVALLVTTLIAAVVELAVWPRSLQPRSTTATA